MVPTFCSMASIYPAMCSSRNTSSEITVFPWSIPFMVPPSPTKCLAHAKIVSEDAKLSPCSPITEAEAIIF